MKIPNTSILNENMATAKSILAKHHMDTTDPDFKKLRELLGNNLGFIGKFTKWLIEDRTPFAEIKETYEEMQNIGGIDRPIESFLKCEQLADYLITFKTKRVSNQVIKVLPAEVRRFVDDRIIKLIELNIDLAEDIKKIYAKKGVSQKSTEQLYNFTKKTIEDLKSWSMSGVLAKIDKLNAGRSEDKKQCNIAAKSDELLFVNIYTFEASCDLGSSSWCISRNKSNFDSYVSEFTEQFFIFDFSKEPDDIYSYCGVTLYPDAGIRAAHWRDDSAVKDPKKIVLAFEERMLAYYKEQGLMESRKSTNSKLVKETLMEATDVETAPSKPTVKPGTKPGPAPSRPNPIRRERPSVDPRPKATEKEVVKKFMELKKKKK